MNEITVETVTDFFERIWATFCPDSVVVELHEHSMKSPFLALVAWDGGAWRILAPANAKTPKALLEILYHEAAHVRAGEVAREPYNFPVARAMMQGKRLVPQAAAVVHRSCEQSQATAAAYQQEDAATVWARAEAVGAWRILAEWRDPREAARVVWWVHNQLRG